MDKIGFVFFRRIFAFVIDYLILFSICFLFCNLFFDQLVAINKFAILIGFLIFVLYFGILNSKLSKGQTLGQKIFKVKTVDNNNNYISVQKSFIRAVLIFTNLIFINHIYIISNITNYADDIILGISLFILLSNLLLFIFNAPSRKLMHDLILNTVVVDEKVETVFDCKICDYGKFYLPKGYFNIHFSAFKLCTFIVIISALVAFLFSYNDYQRLWTVYNKEETKSLYKDIKNLSPNIFLSAYSAQLRYIEEYKDWGYIIIIYVNNKNPEKLSKEDVSDYNQKIYELTQNNFKSIKNKIIYVNFFQKADMGLYVKYKYYSNQ